MKRKRVFLIETKAPCPYPDDVDDDDSFVPQEAWTTAEGAQKAVDEYNIAQPGCFVWAPIWLFSEDEDQVTP